MKRIMRRWIILLCVFLIVIRIAAAQPAVQIISVEPDVRHQTFPLDGRLTEIKCVAKTDRPDMQLQWKLDGPGRFDGATTGIASFYLPPDKLIGTSAQVKITITATDKQGNTVRDTLTFTLLAPSQPTPTPTRTPSPRPTNTPTPKPTRTPTPRPTATPTAMRPTRTPTPHPTVTPTFTPQPTPTRTPVPKPTATPTETPQPMPTRTPVPRITPSPIPTQAPVMEEAVITLTLPEEAGDLVFLKVAGGAYEMGCGVWTDQCGNDEQLHAETVATFWIGQYEITRKQWAIMMGNVNTIAQDDGELPVENVSWNEIQEFIHKVMALFPQYEIRLPTEAEWEYACRSGGQPENYAGGNDPELVAWYVNNSDRRAHPVGQKQPNGLGIYDMSGNVREWTQDDYREFLSGAGGAVAPPKGTKAVRGGGWLNAAKYLRCSNREQYFADSRKSGLGFRLVLKKK